MDITEKSDTEIIGSVLSGDTDLFAVIVDRYKERIFRIVSSHIPHDNVEEVSSDVFFRTFKSLKTFNNDAPFVNWLSVLTVRACKDFWRVNYAKKEAPLSSFSEDVEDIITNSPSNIKTPEEAILNNETKDMLNRAVNLLKPNERMVISLMYLEDKSVAETAETLELSESNVKIIAFRARKKLADMLNEFMGD